jgi:hypothetical protein
VIAFHILRVEIMLHNVTVPVLVLALFLESVDVLHHFMVMHLVTHDIVEFGRATRVGDRYLRFCS